MNTPRALITIITCLLLGAALSTADAQQYSFSTFAGTPGLVGSNDTKGLFNQPYHIARDKDGNIYVADSFSATIRKITPAGVVSTLAGSAGQYANTDGTGAAARFSFPTGVACDSSGNVYVADSVAATIRKITPGGVVTTIAGSAAGFAVGNTDATGNAARFRNPCGLVVDATDTNLYVTDGVFSTSNHNIRKIVLATGVVTTLAGPVGGGGGTTGTTDGTGSAARFNKPSGLDIDSSGNILVCDFSNSTIRKVTPAGAVTTFCGLGLTAGSTDGTGNAARFTGPIGIAISNSDTIFVTESVSNTIRRITPEGEVRTLCGLAGVSGAVDGLAANARLNTPIGIVADGAKSLVVAEFGNHTLRRVSFVKGECTAWVGAAGIPGSSNSVPTTLNGPTSVARDSSGNFYVSERVGGVIRKITPGGVMSTFASGLSTPEGLAIDSAGNLYVADDGTQTIKKITPAGVVSTFAGQTGINGSADGIGGAAQFSAPFDVKIDAAGNLYVADLGNHTIRKITTPGAVVTTIAGLAGQFGSADGLGTTARLNSPTALAVDGAGNVFVADAGNNTIRKMTPGGVVTTVAGLAGSSGSTDGTGTVARFNLGGSGLVSDAAGNLIVSDGNNNTLRKVSSTGVVTTLCGRPGTSGDTDDVGSAARFSFPSKMALDPQGNVYVACYIGQTVRKVTPGGAVSTFIGTPSVAGTGNTGGVFNGCTGVVTDALGNVFVADQNNHTIRMITPAGAVFTYAGQPGVSGFVNGTGGAARFNAPYALAIDGSSNLYVAEVGNNAIRKVTPAGVVTTLAGGVFGSADGTGTAAQFKIPFGICIDPAGANLYVADSLNNTVRKVVIASGAVTTIAGTAGTAGTTNGTGSAALFNTPIGVAADALGNVYVADYANSNIRKIAPGNVVTALAGPTSSAATGTADGTGNAARFNGPAHLALDSTGANLYVSDYLNHTIRKVVTATREVTTIGGLGGSAGTTDGVGASARLNLPVGIALDAAGNLFIGEQGNHAIRKGTRYGAKARLVMPQNGTALPSTTTVFAWDPAIGATNYALFIGTTPGGYDLYAGIEGTNLFRAVTLPADTKVYATMYSYIGGAWQGDGYVFEPAPSQKAVLTSPAQGSTLGSATLNLQWAPGQGCSLYAVWVGSSYGGYDIASAAYNPGTNTGSLTVPADGGPVYVTLWSYVNGAWQRDDSRFITQLGAGNRPARLTAPATNGSTLAAGSTNFIWDTGVGAASYALWVGSTPDGYDLYSGLEGGGTNRSVAIPSDGRKIYVTVHTLMSGSYQSNSYQFTAAGAGSVSPGAVFNTPATGTTLGSASLNLGWTSASGATNYALWVGSAAGTYDIYAGSEGLSQTKTVTVPTDGRVIHTTIWSLIGGTYYPNMSWVTASNTSGTLRAQITSHAQYAALPTANTTFTWNTGSGPTAYALWVGSTANGYDIYSALEGTGTTRAVTLPTDGRQIHVTLWSMISGAWQGNSYIFFAPTNPTVKAALISPTAGSTFTSSSATLNWNAGLGVTQYYLFVGSQAGGYDLYSGDQGTSLTRTLTGLPTDARPIHVTLYSLINGAWRSNAYVFRAWQTP